MRYAANARAAPSEISERNAFTHPTQGRYGRMSKASRAARRGGRSSSKKVIARCLNI
jgi:hypothetical protein